LSSRCHISRHSKDPAATFSRIQKIFYNGTDIDDWRSMQNLKYQLSWLLKVIELDELLKVNPRTIYDGCQQRIDCLRRTS
jgi:hypothetical protein